MEVKLLQEASARIEISQKYGQNLGVGTILYVASEAANDSLASLTQVAYFDTTEKFIRRGSHERDLHDR
jgi:hypothetical protein